MQRDNLGKRQQYTESSSKESFGIRANSTEVYSDREKDSSGEGEGRDGADERRGSVASSREKHYWDDDIKRYPTDSFVMGFSFMYIDMGRGTVVKWGFCCIAFWFTSKPWA